MTQQVNGFATKPDDPSWMPRTYKKGETHNSAAVCALIFTDVKENVYKHAHTIIINKQAKK